ncbi:MarR family transcriptional regulator [Actinoplanes ianthinogenes]|uniref:MarR family transcriptional regulator n=1 Tax=Actinoplanes ianthinogenes TaxID=122358 RepID=A0ABN6CN60_9ACTN|nr:MarR family transcriptional regulator [Actinoplanes ianthinogenes]BCJ46600.1 MarR family transcriptional regulator [Actinoplanes ianthinogenes]GGR17055.1 MarR family transcriptional regulator [Actinoplanes ianthinogenes]
MDQLPSWLLTQAAAHAHRLVGDGFAEVGARGYHYRLLESLIADGPASQAALGRRTGIHLSDLVGALNELEEDGYVARSPDPGDRRRNVITVTETGQERSRDLAERAAAIQDELLAPLSAGEREQLAALLRKVLTGASRRTQRV